MASDKVISLYLFTNGFIEPGVIECLLTVSIFLKSKTIGSLFILRSNIFHLFL